ncbi:CRT10-domain-containing protein [Lipomyces kononenkoae]|uniref:CRT10-domain-containing protein n=1 Tax=Lipomyces kononenkoae TaxID=34357 RepID=A0ACC3T7K2_LIPKO
MESNVVSQDEQSQPVRTATVTVEEPSQLVVPANVDEQLSIMRPNDDSHEYSNGHDGNGNNGSDSSDSEYVDEDGEDDEDDDEDDEDDEDEDEDEDVDEEDEQARRIRQTVHGFQSGPITDFVTTFAPHHVPSPVNAPEKEDVPAMLDLQPVGRQKVMFHSPETWRVNLMSISRYGFLFIADGENIKVFRISSPARPELVLFTQLAPPKPSPPTISQILGANNPMNIFSINALKIGTLGGEEHVVILTDAGQAIIYSTASILRHHDQENSGENSTDSAADTAPVFVLQVERSAWGVDLHDREKLVVVSDNSHSITIFKLGFSDNWYTRDEKQRTQRRQKRQRAAYSSSEEGATANESASANASDADRHEKRSYRHDHHHKHNVYRSSAPQTRRTRDSEAFSRVIHNAHDNNIPNVRFVDVPIRDPTADIMSTQVCVLSASIDGDIKLWDINTMRCISGSLFLDKKGWSCLPLWKRDFALVPNINIISGMKPLADGDDPTTGRSLHKPDSNLIISYPLKSRSPYMTTTRRKRQENADGDEAYPYVMYEEVTDALEEYEAQIYVTSMNRMNYEHNILDPRPGQRPPDTPSSYDDNPILSDEERKSSYILDDLILFHATIYQTRLVVFKDGEQNLANICPAVFGKRIPRENFTASFDRLNMSVVIPELACVVVASQEGLVSVFKLCKTDNEHIGLKQEYVIAEQKKFATNNTLIGLDVCPVETDGLDLSRRFMLFLIYLNGTVVTYQLRRHDVVIIEDVQDFDELVF